MLSTSSAHVTLEDLATLLDQVSLLYPNSVQAHCLAITALSVLRPIPPVISEDPSCREESARNSASRINTHCQE